MTPGDYIVIVLAVAGLVGSGFWASRRSRKSSSDFILGGRSLPWWLGGAAMVAGATSCDSPLHQSAKVRREGLPGAWFYWSQVLAVIWHSLVFSRLWRRTQVTTVVEFYHIRYSGRAAKIGRVWSMVFASLLGSTISLALSLLAMIKICQVMLDLPAAFHLGPWMFSSETIFVLVALALALSYSVAAGLRGVVTGDFIEFIVVIACSYLLMFFVLRAVGFAPGLRAGLAASGHSTWLSLRPSMGISFLVFFFIQPLANVAGDNGLNQRFLALHDERQAVFSGLWRMVTHYFLRAWPWYICGLCSVILLTQSALPSELAYPQLIKQYMPAGWRGLMFAGFLVAFMSCVGNAMHNAGVVFINDFYRPFLVPHASDRHYLWAIRITMVATAIVGTGVALSSDQILRLLQISLTIVGSSGLVMLLRWFWWRVNGWADLTAQIAALPVTLFYTSGPGTAWVKRLADCFSGHSADDIYGLAFILSLLTTTALWLFVMYVTPPEPRPVLREFFTRVRPYGWWRPIAEELPDIRVTDRVGRDVGRYILGLSVTCGLLFGFGLLLLGYRGAGAGLLLVASGAGATLIRSINREYTSLEHAHRRHTDTGGANS